MLFSGNLSIYVHVDWLMLQIRNYDVYVRKDVVFVLQAFLHLLRLAMFANASLSLFMLIQLFRTFDILA